MVNQRITVTQIMQVKGVILIDFIAVIQLSYLPPLRMNE